MLAVEVFAPTDQDFRINFVDWMPTPPDKDMGLSILQIASRPVDSCSAFVILLRMRRDPGALVVSFQRLPDGEPVAMFSCDSVQQKRRTTMTQTEIHLHQTATLTPEQYVAGLTDLGPGRSKLFGNSADEYLKVHHRDRSEASRKARVASGNACTTTGPIPTASSSRRPTPTCGEARPATPTPSRVSLTARPTLTWPSYARARTSRDGCSASCSGPSVGAFWKRRFKTPSKPSKPGTPRRESGPHNKPGSLHARRSGQAKFRELLPSIEVRRLAVRAVIDLHHVMSSDGNINKVGYRFSFKPGPGIPRIVAPH